MICKLLRKVISFVLNIKCVQQRLEKVLTIFLSLFYGYLVLIYSVISIARNRTKFFQVRRRDVAPDCLSDPTLGTHYFAQLNDVKLHYVMNGNSDNQTILFIHGFPEFWYSWRHQLREFAKDYHVVAVDNRGYGQSDKPSAIKYYTVDKLVDDVRQLLQLLDKKRVVLVGHDWGGAIAWNFAAKYPEQVERLVILNAPHPRAFMDLIHRSWKQFFSSWYMFFFNLPLLPELVLLSNDLNLLDQFMVTADGQPICTQEDMEAYKYVFSKYNSLTCPLNYYRAIMRKYRCQQPTTFQITVPTLLIWGKRDTALVPQLAEVSQRYVTDLTVRYIDNCSHWTQMDQPLIVNQYIHQFLDSERR